MNWTTKDLWFDSWKGQRFNLLQSVWTDLGVYPTSSLVGAGGDFLRDKAAAAHLQREQRVRMGGAVPSLFHVSERHVPRLLFVLILNGWLYTSLYSLEGWKVWDSYMDWGMVWDVEIKQFPYVKCVTAHKSGLLTRTCPLLHSVCWLQIYGHWFNQRLYQYWRQRCPLDQLCLFVIYFINFF